MTSQLRSELENFIKADERIFLSSFFFVSSFFHKPMNDNKKLFDGVVFKLDPSIDYLRRQQVSL
jgi:hypothetical protein